MRLLTAGDDNPLVVGVSLEPVRGRADDVLLDRVAVGLDDDPGGGGVSEPWKPLIARPRIVEPPEPGPSTSPSPVTPLPFD